MEVTIHIFFVMCSRIPYTEETATEFHDSQLTREIYRNFHTAAFHVGCFLRQCIHVWLHGDLYKYRILHEVGAYNTLVTNCRVGLFSNEKNVLLCSEPDSKYLNM